MPFVLPFIVHAHHIYVLVLLALLLMSAFQHPDPTAPTFQLPGLLPSAIPPLHTASPLLTSLLEQTRTSLQETCPHYTPHIYSEISLTPSQEGRFRHLRGPSDQMYLFVTTTREIADQLPDLFNTLLVLTHYLGPQHVAFSILEGPSDDCTPQALETILTPTLLEMGVPRDQILFDLRQPPIEWGRVHRIETLAKLRNQAMSPLWSHVYSKSTGTVAGADIGPFESRVKAVVFFNDVFMCARDVLELLHQHVVNGAGLTAGMDWYQKRPAFYYDIWVGRTVRCCPETYN